MHKFVIISHNVHRGLNEVRKASLQGFAHFTAKDDKAAEQYVEENYDDGEQILYRLSHVMEWG